MNKYYIEKPLLTVIVPVFNEEKTIAEIIKLIQQVDIPKEIIVVDDGSTDGTKKILSQLKKDSLKILYHEYNRGKGRAIRTGLCLAIGNIIIVQDADLEYDPNDYHAILNEFKNGYEVVYGSRTWNCFKRKFSSSVCHAGVVILSKLASVLYDEKITDIMTCYKAFRSHVIKRMLLEYDGFEFCAEATVKVRKLGYRIKETPISYQPRFFSEGKKITWKDGIKILIVLLKYWRSNNFPLEMDINPRLDKK